MTPRSANVDPPPLLQIAAPILSFPSSPLSRLSLSLSFPRRNALANAISTACNYSIVFMDHLTFSPALWEELRAWL